MEKLKTKFLILGGGLTGLFVALFLKREGQECVVVEKSDDVGGLARTYSFRGHSFDIGGHRISFHDKQNTDLLHSLVPELSVLSRESKIYYNNSYIDYPISFASLQKFNKKSLVKIFFEIIFSNRFLIPKNFEEWIKKYYGATIYNIVFEHYSKKVWGKDCKELSANWAKKRIGYYSISQMFLNNKAKEGIQEFYYPKGGIGAISQKICEKILPEATILKNSTLKGMTVNGDKIQRVECEVFGEDYSIECEHVVSTIPLTEMLQIIPFCKKEQLKTVSKKIKYRSFLQVNLLLDHEQASDWHWCYFPNESLLFSRCYEPKYWHKGMSEKDKGTMLCVEVFCDYQDDVWNMDENLLVNKVCEQLIGIGLMKDRNECQNFFVLRERYAYPLPFLGYDTEVKKVIQELSLVQNLDLAGRNGTHSYFDIEECIESARKVVRKLKDTREDC